MTADWDNLREHILERLGPKAEGGLGWTWKEFEAETDFSPSYRYRLLRGDYKELKPASATAIDRALGWVSGSAYECLKGGKPALAKPSKTLRAPKRVELTQDDVADDTPNGQPSIIEVLDWWRKKVDTRFTREDMGQIVADFIALAPGVNDIPIQIFQRWAHTVTKVFTYEDLGRFVADVMTLREEADGGQ